MSVSKIPRDGNVIWMTDSAVDLCKYLNSISYQYMVNTAPCTANECFSRLIWYTWVVLQTIAQVLSLGKFGPYKI